jgi:hypothetical protein
MNIRWIAVCVTALFLASSVVAQNKTPESVDETLMLGDIVATNIQTALSPHIALDGEFTLKKQEPADSVRDFAVLFYKDGTMAFDWTTGQHARYLMEELRQGIHELQSASKPRGLDVVALGGARDAWPKLRDIACKEYPGIRYYDLDGFERYCAGNPPKPPVSRR